jgi:hypothetical protein
MSLDSNTKDRRDVSQRTATPALGLRATNFFKRQRSRADINGSSLHDKQHYLSSTFCDNDFWTAETGSWAESIWDTRHDWTQKEFLHQKRA